jgi:hypothetical protein
MNTNKMADDVNEGVERALASLVKSHRKERKLKKRPEEGYTGSGE